MTVWYNFTSASGLSVLLPITEEMSFGIGRYLLPKAELGLDRASGDLKVGYSNYRASALRLDARLLPKSCLSNILIL